MGGSAPVHSSGRPTPLRTKMGSKVCSAPRPGSTAVISVTCRRTEPEPVAPSWRSTCTTTSSASENTRRTMPSVTFSPAISAAFTNASRLRARCSACTVHMKPHPALTARESSNASAPAHFTDHDPVGTHREHELHQVSQEISPVPSSPVGGPRRARARAVPRAHGPLARTDAVTGGRREQRPRHRGLARARCSPRP